MADQAMTQSKPSLFADFQNADRRGRLRLNCVGTAEDLDSQGIELTDGLQVLLCQDDLEVEGSVVYSEAENIWVAEIDWNVIRGSHSGFKP